MTGTGAAALEHDLGRFEAEARSVNHRFLKTSVRSQGPLPPIDAVAERAVKEQVARGHVTVFVRYVPAASSDAVRVNEGAFAAGAERLRDLADRHDLGSPAVGDVLQLPGVLGDSAAVRADAKRILAPASEALTQAVEAMVATRRREGALLAEEIGRLLAAIRDSLRVVEKRADDVPRAIQARLQARITDLLRDSPASVDEAQVAREAAVLADRADVREETARLAAHLVHAEEVLAEGGAVGRTLDFLVQEMHREANTIGSKCADLEISRTVVALKADVERLREQVQNIE